jgi:fucose permease
MSRTVAGLYGPALAIGALIGGASFPYLVRRLPFSAVLAIGLIGLASGVAMFCLLTSVPGTLTAAAVAMTFGALVLSGVSTGLSERHGANSAAALSEANAASAGMGFLAPLLIHIAVGAGLGWRPAMALVIVLAGTLAVVTQLTQVRGAAGSRLVIPARPHSPRGRLPKRYWLAWMCLLAIMSVETGLLLWAPEQLREQTGMAAGTAAVGVSAVLAGMLVGRLAGGWVATRIPTGPLLLAALTLAAAGFAVFWSATEPHIAVAGLACCGLGMALHFPLGVALTMRASNGQVELAMSRNFYGIAFGLGAAPFLLGALADRVGIGLALGLIPVCLLIAALSVAQLTRSQPPDPKPEAMV